MDVRNVTKQRIERAFLVWVLGFGILAAQLLRLQAFGRSPDPNLYVRHERRQPRRANLLTRNHTLLATSVPCWDVGANPREVRNRRQVAHTLAALLNQPPADLLRKLSQTTQRNGKPNFYVPVKKRVGEPLASRIRKLAQRQGKDQPAVLEGVYLYPNTQRQYPLGRLASQIVGFVDWSGKGVDGLELGFNRTLSGRPGWVESEVDALGRPVAVGWRKVVPPREGHDVVVTIDENIQAIAEEVARKCLAERQPHWVCVIVMQPRTGEVLAMTTQPDFDPSHVVPEDLQEGHAINRAVNFSYEPGSTFKIVTTAAAVEAVPHWRHLYFFCGRGGWRFGRQTVHCWVVSKGRGHGALGLGDGLAKSCNMVMGGFARAMGAQAFATYARRLGFGAKTGVGLPSEQSGLLPDLKEWKRLVRLTNTGFGQGLRITSMQLINAVCAIAHDGVMMQPRIVKEIRTPQGQLVQTFPPRPARRALSAEAARQVKMMMRKVVTEGTGKQAEVKGFPVAGKTGTAQKAVGKLGYRANKHVASFVGFLPVHDPQLAILVVADEPRGEQHGSVVCAPYFREIAERAMLRLKMEPTLVAKR